MLAQLYQFDQYQTPSWGPSRDQNRNGFHEAEPLYHNQIYHESSGTILEGSSTGFDTGHAWIEANDKTGSGKVWKTPSKNSLTRMVDRNLT